MEWLLLQKHLSTIVTYIEDRKASVFVGRSILRKALIAAAMISLNEEACAQLSVLYASSGTSLTKTVSY